MQEPREEHDGEQVDHDNQHIELLADPKDVARSDQADFNSQRDQRQVSANDMLFERGHPPQERDDKSTHSFSHRLSRHQ